MKTILAFLLCLSTFAGDVRPLPPRAMRMRAQAQEEPKSFLQLGDQVFSKTNGWHFVYAEAISPEPTNGVKLPRGALYFTLKNETSCLFLRFDTSLGGEWPKRKGSAVFRDGARVAFTNYTVSLLQYETNGIVRAVIDWDGGKLRIDQFGE